MAETNRRSVLVLMHAWVGFIQGVQVGIARYFAEHPEWTWTRQFPLPSQIARLGVDHYDGVIAYAELAYLPQLKRMGVPVVNVSNSRDDYDLPAVFSDDAAVGQMAARHLSDLGLRHFAWAGPVATVYARQRKDAFVAALAGQGVTMDGLDIGSEAPVALDLPPGIDPTLLAWLRRVPKPIGIFGVSDEMASSVLRVARYAGIDVPQQVCVLGVDNDELLTQLSYPPLSSIALPTQQIGYESAKLLDRLMAGAPAPTKPILLDPVGVVSRQSTNLLAIADADVQTAIRYIRDSSHKRVTVKDLLDIVALNRRYFERKFKKHLGRTPLQEILRVRVERAKELLSGTDLSMAAIAKRSGFTNAEQLSTVFRRMTKTTPTLYRRGHRLREG